MNILLTNHMETTYPGGINKVVRELASSFSFKGHDIIVVQPNDSNLTDNQEYLGSKLIRVKYKYDKFLYGIKLALPSKLDYIIKEFNPHIIHVHGYHSLFSHEIAWILRKGYAKIPLVFSPHFDIAGSTFAGRYAIKLLNNTIGRRIFNQSMRIITCSDFEAKKIKDIFGIKDQIISIIPHGVNRINRKSYCKLIGNKGKINLLFSGYLIKRKGVRYILNSLYSLIYKYNFKKVSLIIIGDGPEKDNLRKIALRLNINEYIRWLPFVEYNELVKMIEESDFFLLLSESEAFGITIAEALTLGTPVIVTKRAALEEFKNEPGCFLVNYPPNSNDVAKIILNSFGSKVNIGPFTSKIRLWNDVTMDYEEIYNRILNNS
ncbi:glycosyltransferase family 4 protein [Desulfotomaculum copahuensis]|uniref:glycosyltransferase family 4 protein n=1 Tax=Desulfotomaculum copahuensis TaxID=1838280 RepID=UPI00099017DA|nr:glycosyltransferase family 4 protein [Desulfotomaculum copahuensis]